MKLSALACSPNNLKKTKFAKIFEGATACDGLPDCILDAGPRFVSSLTTNFDPARSKYFNDGTLVDLKQCVAMNKHGGADADIGCCFNATATATTDIYLAGQMKDYSWDLKPAKVGSVLAKAKRVLPEPTIPVIYSRFATAEAPSSDKYTGPYVIVAAQPSFFAGLQSHPILSQRVYILNLETKGQLCRLVRPGTHWSKDRVLKVVDALFEIVGNYRHVKADDGQHALFCQRRLIALAKTQSEKDQVQEDLTSLEFSADLIFPKDLSVGPFQGAITGTTTAQVLVSYCTVKHFTQYVSSTLTQQQQALMM